MARPALHAGASGVVCGYLGLLMAVVLRRPCQFTLGAGPEVVFAVFLFVSVCVLHLSGCQQSMLSMDLC